MYDECHGLRGRESQLAAALRARNRWLISGTPFNNSGGAGLSLGWLLAAVVGRPIGEFFGFEGDAANCSSSPPQYDSWLANMKQRAR